MFYSKIAFKGWGRFRIPAVIMMALIFLSGCMVGPNYVRPTAQVPPAYKETKGWKPAEPKDAIIRGPWWEVFNDPQLNALEAEVNISNQNIVVAEAEYRQSREMVQAARAALFPIITADTSYTRQRNSKNAPFSVPPVKAFSDYLLTGDTSWELDLWGALRRGVASARASAQASAANFEVIRLSSQAQLAQDYFQLRGLDAQKQLLDATVAIYEKFLMLTNNRYKSGVASKADVLQAETQLKTTQAQEIDIGVQRAQLEHAIALLAGKPASVFSIAVSEFNATPPDIPLSLPSELLERRPDIAQAERQAAAANEQIGIALSAYYPTVTLTASGGLEAANFAKWLAWPSNFWSLGPVTASETIYDAGLRAAQTGEARAVYDASIATYRQTVLTAFQETEDSLAALRILKEEAEVQEEAVDVAQQSANITKNQYKAGTATALEVIITQAIALNSQVSLVNISSRRMVASVMLIQALGGGWQVAELPTPKELNTNKNLRQIEEENMERASEFEKIANKAPIKNGAKEMTYDQFMQLRNSGEQYTLVDALPSDSYNSGHIEGAISFPLDTINKDNAKNKIPQGSHVVVYCASFKCPVSTTAAKKLSKLGYNVLDYKGGLKEWQEKGNGLVK